MEGDKKVSRRAAIATAGASAIALGVLAPEAQAAPNGTRPTKLTDLAVTSVSSSQMRASGRLMQVSGQPVAGVPIKVYVVGTAYFTLMGTGYTGSDGRFNVTASKGPAGTWVQIEFEGNGAYSRAYPTFNRP